MEYFLGTSAGAESAKAEFSAEERAACVQGLLEAVNLDRSDVVVSMLKAIVELHPDSVRGILDGFYPYGVDGNATLLHIASRDQKVNVLRALLNANADPSIKDSSGKTCYEVADANESVLAGFMLDFLQSISSSNLVKVQQMIAAGVDVNSKTVALPIQYASCFGTAEIVRVLITAGANVNATDTNGSTALHDAAQQGDIAIVRVLLSAGADPTYKGLKGKVKDKTPLDVATHSDDTKLLELKQLLSGELVPTAFEDLLQADTLLTSTTNANASETTNQVPPTSKTRLPSTSTETDANITTHNTDTNNANGDGMYNPRSTVTNEYVSIQTALDDRLKFLWPMPKKIVQIEGEYIQMPLQPAVWVQGFGKEVASSSELILVSERLRYEINALGFKTVRVCAHDGQRAHITLRLNPKLLSRPQSYRLSIDDLGVSIVASDVQGLHYAVTTLVQIFRLFDISAETQENADDDFLTGLPPIKITDYPDLSVRGFLLDVSSNKMPTLKTLFGLVDKLVLFKYNQIQLCFENAFGYSKHKVVWENTNAYQGLEILHLEEYCRRRGIALVPHQASFGNFESWLKHPQYNKLAECPVEAANAVHGQHHSLNPSNRNTLKLMQDMYSELLPHFSASSYFHVGFGEMDDFGTGGSEQFCARYSRDAVYLEYMFKIRQLAMMHNRTPMIWGDVVQTMPDRALYELNEDVVVCERGCEEDHPFDHRCQRLSEAAIPFFVCPGTSSWNSFGGRTANCIENIKKGVQSGVTHGAIGMLLMDWGENGHLQPMCTSYPAIVVGGLAWNQTPQPMAQPAASKSQVEDWTDEWGQDDVARLLDVYIFSDGTRTLGRAICELGNTYLHTGGGQPGNTNGTALFEILIFPNRETPTLRKGLTLAGLHAASKHVKKQLALLTEQLQHEASLHDVVDDLRTMGQLSILACHLGQLLLKNDCDISSLPVTHRTDLANRLMQLTEKLEAGWKRSNRPSGVTISLEALQHTTRCLLKGC
eukprot:m.218943 g.218943  ORF g.218943 m.218943 type:complete len:994 (+) comp33281_c0_seq2:111-3092(+)